MQWHVSAAVRQGRCALQLNGNGRDGKSRGADSWGGGRRARTPPMAAFKLHMAMASTSVQGSPVQFLPQLTYIHIHSCASITTNTQRTRIPPNQRNPTQSNLTQPSPSIVSHFSAVCCHFWAFFSQGFTYPHEAGYPIESRQAKYYLMETHYNNLKPDFAQLHARQMADNSGLKIYFTHVLRPNDAGTLSIGKYPHIPTALSLSITNQRGWPYSYMYVWIYKLQLGGPAGASGRAAGALCIFYATGLSISV